MGRRVHLGSPQSLDRRDVQDSGERGDEDRRVFLRCLKPADQASIRFQRAATRGLFDIYFAGYDGINATLEFEKSGGGTEAITDLKHRFLWVLTVDQLFADEQLATLTNSNTIWALGDHLGTLRDLADFGTNFSITNHRVYDSFGKLTSETNATIDLLFAYTGKYFDDITNLSNHWNRWFETQIGK